MTPTVANIIALAKQASYDPALLVAQAWVESRFDPNALSHVGALGIFQFMPSTARELGIDPVQPGQATDGAIRYMKQLLAHYHGNQALALAAYNWGEGHVDGHIHNRDAWPSETVHYVALIESYAELLREVIV